MGGGEIKDYSGLIKDNAASAYVYFDIVKLWNSPDRGFLITILLIISLLVVFILYSSIGRGDFNKKISSIKNPQLRTAVIFLVSIIALILTFIIFSSGSFSKIFENFLYSI